MRSRHRIGRSPCIFCPRGTLGLGASGIRVQIFNGVGLQPHSQNPLDPGLDGVLGGGDAQIRVTFRVTGFGVGQLRIGTDYYGDGAVFAGGVLPSSAAFSSFLRIDHAPALGVDLLAAKRGAGGPRVSGLAGVERAVGADAALHVLGILLGVNRRCIVLVTECDRIGVFLVNAGGLRRRGSPGQQHHASSGYESEHGSL